MMKLDDAQAHAHSLANEALAKMLVDGGVGKMLMDLTMMRPYLIELALRFKHLKKGETIMGYTSMDGDDGFCIGEIGRTYRACKYAMDGGNKKRKKRIAPKPTQKQLPDGTTENKTENVSVLPAVVKLEPGMVLSIEGRKFTLVSIGDPMIPYDDPFIVPVEGINSYDHHVRLQLKEEQTASPVNPNDWAKDAVRHFYEPSGNGINPYSTACGLENGTKAQLLITDEPESPACIEALKKEQPAPTANWIKGWYCAEHGFLIIQPSARTSAPSGMMRVVPMPLKSAKKYVAAIHRHHKPPCGHKFSIGCEVDGKLVGVAMCSRPANPQIAAKGNVLEVSRVATDGTKNACSNLYSACARAAQAMGYDKIQTYILVTEPGITLEASGWYLDKALCGDKRGTRFGKNRKDNIQRQEAGHEAIRKRRWAKDLTNAKPTASSKPRVNGAANGTVKSTVI